LDIPPLFLHDFPFFWANSSRNWVKCTSRIPTSIPIPKIRKASNILTRIRKRKIGDVIADDPNAFSYTASAIKRESTAHLPALALTAKITIPMRYKILIKPFIFKHYRKNAIQSTLDRNPNAFQPKISTPKVVHLRKKRAVNTPIHRKVIHPNSCYLLYYRDVLAKNQAA